MKFESAPSKSGDSREDVEDKSRRKFLRVLGAGALAAAAPKAFGEIALHEDVAETADATESIESVKSVEAFATDFNTFVESNIVINGTTFYTKLFEYLHEHFDMFIALPRKIQKNIAETAALANEAEWGLDDLTAKPEFERLFSNLQLHFLEHDYLLNPFRNSSDEYATPVFFETKLESRSISQYKNLLTLFDKVSPDTELLSCAIDDPARPHRRGFVMTGLDVACFNKSRFTIANSAYTSAEEFDAGTESNEFAHVILNKYYNFNSMTQERVSPEASNPEVNEFISDVASITVSSGVARAHIERLLAMSRLSFHKETGDTQAESWWTQPTYDYTTNFLVDSIRNATQDAANAEYITARLTTLASIKNQEMKHLDQDDFDGYAELVVNANDAIVQLITSLTDTQITAIQRAHLEQGKKFIKLISETQRPSVDSERLSGK